MPGMIEKGLNHCSVSVHPKNNRQYSSEVELSPAVHNEEYFVLTTERNNSENNLVNNISDNNVFDDSNKCEVDGKLETDSCNDLKEDSDDDLLKEIDEVLSEKSSNHSSEKLSPAKELSQSIFYDKPEPMPERIDKMDDIRDQMETPPILKIPLDQCGFPLDIFNCGSYCQPYLSLTYLDVLTDVRVRSCLVGATNFLFKQKKDIFDVIVEVNIGISYR